MRKVHAVYKTSQLYSLHSTTLSHTTSEKLFQYQRNTWRGKRTKKHFTVQLQCDAELKRAWLLTRPQEVQKLFIKFVIIAEFGGIFCTTLLRRHKITLQRFKYLPSIIHKACLNRIWFGKLIAAVPLLSCVLFGGLLSAYKSKPRQFL